jgi:hypothetical protein
MTITLPGAAATEPAPSRCSRARVGRSSHSSSKVCNLIQVGSLCLAVIRQTLPGRLQGTHVAEPVHVQAVDSNEESDLEESALTRICLARQMQLLRRELRTNRRKARCVSRGDSNCFLRASLRSASTDIQRIAACGFQSIFKYERREPGWHGHRKPAKTGFAG